MKESQDKGKYNNFFKQVLINNFLGEVVKNIEALEAKNLIDVGCGEGYPEAFFLKRLPYLTITGLDLNNEYLKQARKKNPDVKYLKGDIFKLDFKPETFDLAIVLEVLEHLENPSRAIKQVKKVAKKTIFSVPHEPWFSLMSFLSGSYTKAFGKHPEHINSWNKETFIQMLLKHYNKVSIKSAFPWIIALCEK